ncbi:nucleotide-binding domain-containing protein [Atractiella rhizophila]|nr:nucleotide-binding domain-containing protein [Atractiella rhizophila]
MVLFRRNLVNSHQSRLFQQFQSRLLLRRRFAVIPTAKKVVKWSFYLTGVFTASMGVGILGLLVWDFSTYKEIHSDRVPAMLVRLHPRKGGPKNLYIADVHLDEDERLRKKEKLVILGGGWGAVSTLNHLDTQSYNVTVIAPEKYNLFTPLLPSAAVGTLEPRSLVEPLRKIISRLHGHYLQARAVDILPEERLIEVVVPSGARVRGENGHDKDLTHFYVPYDKCITSVGAVSATHGVPGVEHCFQLKTIKDALDIRRRILSQLEMATLPNIDEDERDRLLSFVVCGGGPTGVEFAAEMCDMVKEDCARYLPPAIRDRISINVIQSRDHLLNTYSEAISRYAEKRFEREHINTILNARVKAITPNSVTYSIKDRSGRRIEKTIPAGFVLWSTGISMNPLTKQVSDKLPNQSHLHAFSVDSHLRVRGAPLGTLYAIGDCATMETRLVDYLMEVVGICDKDDDGKIDFEEFEKLMKIMKRKFPTSTIHIEKIRETFDAYDADHSGALNLDQMAALFQEISDRMTTLPATAQVASQQGKYLGKKLSKIARSSERLEEQDLLADPDDLVSDPFVYKHLGSLAYLGNSAALDYEGRGFAGGLIAMYLWRSVYLSEQVSFRTRAMLVVDWIKRGIWGRDLSNFQGPQTS